MPGRPDIVADADPGAAFAERLKQAIGERTVDDVAHAAGMDASNLRRMLRGEGKCAPRTDTVLRLASATSVPAGWLAWGPKLGGMTPPPRGEEGDHGE